MKHEIEELLVERNRLLRDFVFEELRLIGDRLDKHLKEDFRLINHRLERLEQQMDVQNMGKPQKKAAARED